MSRCLRTMRFLRLWVATKATFQFNRSSPAKVTPAQHQALQHCVYLCTQHAPLNCTKARLSVLTVGCKFCHIQSRALLHNFRTRIWHGVHTLPANRLLSMCVKRIHMLMASSCGQRLQCSSQIKEEVQRLSEHIQS